MLIGMDREAMLKLYDRLTGLVERLPGGLQKPILNELVPIREMFLEVRAARVMLTGDIGRSAHEFLLEVTGGKPLRAGAGDNGWRYYEMSGMGGVEIMDARSDVPEEIVRAGVARFAPDVIVILQEAGSGVASAQAVAARAALCDRGVPVAAVAFGGDRDRARVSAAIASERELASRRTAVFNASEPEEFAEGLCAMLPNDAKLEFARLSGAKRAQSQIARSLLKSFTAVCGVIGVQPIPLADLPVLTTLQTLMVALIIQTTGRKAGPRLVAEFVGALGFNVGAGLLFREGARALVKVVPFWGNAVSGMVAGAGTYAIGRAAIAYFIEDAPITETRKLFRRLLPGKHSAEPPPPPPLPE